jgi:hypothetical protein
MIFQSLHKSVATTDVVATDIDWRAAKSVNCAYPLAAHTVSGRISGAIIEQIPHIYVREAYEMGRGIMVSVSVMGLEPGDFPRRPGWSIIGSTVRPDHMSPPINVHRPMVCVFSQGSQESPMEFFDPGLVLDIDPALPLSGQIEEGFEENVGLVEAGDVTALELATLTEYAPNTLHRWHPAQDVERLIIVDVFQTDNPVLDQIPGFAYAKTDVPQRVYRQVKPMSFV